MSPLTRGGRLAVDRPRYRSRPAAPTTRTKGDSAHGMYYIEDRIATNRDLTRALKRIRRRLAGRCWEMDGSGRIRCELLPSVEGHPRRMCCPLGMLAAEAPRARLDRTLHERTNPDWKTTVAAFVDLEIRGHVQALAKHPKRLQHAAYAEWDLVRLGVALAVNTIPSDPTSERILAMEAATIRVLSEAADHPNSQTGILLTRSLSTESNTLAEDFRKHFRRTVAEAAAVFRAASAITRRRTREARADVHNEDGRLGRHAAAREPAEQAQGPVISFGVGLWRMFRRNSPRTERA